MMLTRRACLAGLTAAAGELVLGAERAVAQASKPAMPKFGMCDWSLQRQDPTAFELAAKIGLDGVEVSVGDPSNNVWIRRPAVQKEYLEAARKQGLAIPSLAMGVLNHIPLMSEPRAAVWVADSIEAARAMGARSILMAFFSKGELKAENKEDMRRVTEALVELAPRAEKAGVTLGLESYLAAEDLLKILEEVKSPGLKVYYDIYNVAHAKHDPIKELKLLGRERICQIHFKDYPSLEKGSGTVDWPRAVATIREIGYDGWIVLETPCPNNDVVNDTKKNLEYARNLFART